MCVAVVAKDARLTEDHVKKMFASNKDGAGIAYREGGKVQWRKGLGEEEILDLCLTVPLPYAAHFRIASCGGVRPELTHPFPIQRDASLQLRGSTSGYVLIHNGHYSRWRDVLLNTATGQGIKLPTGAWSDTRLMAWVASLCGINILPHFDEKLVAYGLENIEIYGTGWSTVDGLVVSNRGWEHTHHTVHYPNLLCRYGQCKEEKWNNTGFCKDHQPGWEIAARTKREEEQDARGVASDPATFRGGHNHAPIRLVKPEAVEKVALPLRGRGAQEQEGPGEEGTTASLHSLKAGRDMINWVRRLNPKAIRSSRNQGETELDWDAMIPH